MTMSNILITEVLGTNAELDLQDEHDEPLRFVTFQFGVRYKVRESDLALAKTGLEFEHYAYRSNFQANRWQGVQPRSLLAARLAQHLWQAELACGGLDLYIFDAVTEIEKVTNARGEFTHYRQHTWYHAKSDRSRLLAASTPLHPVYFAEDNGTPVCVDDPERIAYLSQLMIDMARAEDEALREFIADHPGGW